MMLSLLFVAGTLGAPLPQATRDEPAAVEETARSKKRLLHLAGGGVIRASARETDGRWEYKRGRDWIALPPGSVVRVAVEREVLAESRKLAGKIRRDEHEKRVEYARWLAGEGLLEECLAAIDRILDAAPDHAPTLAFIAEHPVRLALPSVAEERAEFLVRASRMSPAGCELAVAELSEVAAREPEVLQSELEAELAATTSTRRAFAALALRRLFPGEAISPLLRRAVLDPVSRVRDEAGLALRDAENAEVAVPLIQALSSSHSIVRRHAADALGVMNHAIAVEPLVATLQSSSGYRPAASNIFVGRQQAYVQDFDVEVSQGEAIADPQINVLSEGSVLDARVLSASQSSIATERSAIRGALGRLTGAKVRNTQNAWQQWWDANGLAFQREHGLVAMQSE